MITPEEVRVILRSYLPDAPSETIARLSLQICREVELNLFMLIREAVSSFQGNYPYE